MCGEESSRQAQRSEFAPTDGRLPEQKLKPWLQKLEKVTASPGRTAPAECMMPACTRPLPTRAAPARGR